ncbi:methylated-DNA--[protein]-cysteine S-methyltransferase [Desulfocucumis palustris]|nr:methylated-DNA--[protein]-cysteine S-methyltransferase [Desulfocucumis palustris]
MIVINSMEKAYIETRAGFMGAAWTEKGLVALTLPEETIAGAHGKLDAELLELCHKIPRDIKEAEDDGLAKRIKLEMERYFSGEPTEFTLPVDWSYCTPFRKRILSLVKEIPWGEVRSYGETAILAGTPGGARAVGGALGSNKILLVVPCHRVIRNDRTLGGFGGGLEWKQRLLAIERFKY